MMNLPRVLIVSTKEGKAKEIAESKHKFSSYTSELIVSISDSNSYIIILFIAACFSLTCLRFAISHSNSVYFDLCPT